MAMIASLEFAIFSGTPTLMIEGLSGPTLY